MVHQKMSRICNQTYCWKHIYEQVLCIWKNKNSEFMRHLNCSNHSQKKNCFGKILKKKQHFWRKIFPKWRYLNKECCVKTFKPIETLQLRAPLVCTFVKKTWFKKMKISRSIRKSAAFDLKMSVPIAGKVHNGLRDCKKENLS